MRLSLFLLVCLSILISGCAKTITVKHLNPDESEALESNERVVFGRFIFIMHSEAMGEGRLPPLGLGLVNVETGKRALRAVMYEKTAIIQPPSGDIVTRELPTERTWFEDDGTFFWVLPTGSYKIDALGWGFARILFRSDPDTEKPKAEQIFPLKPARPPECGFVVEPNIVFNVSGDSRTLYIGSLVIDMDIKKNKHGIEAKKINRVEIRDEYAQALELLKSRYPSYTLTAEKRLMTGTPDRSASVANRRCPTWIQMLFRETAAGAILVAPVLVAPAVGPAITITAVPIGK